MEEVSKRNENSFPSEQPGLIDRRWIAQVDQSGVLHTLEMLGQTAAFGMPVEYYNHGMWGMHHGVELLEQAIELFLDPTDLDALSVEAGADIEDLAPALREGLLQEFLEAAMRRYDNGFVAVEAYHSTPYEDLPEHVRQEEQEIAIAMSMLKVLELYRRYMGGRLYIQTEADSFSRFQKKRWGSLWMDSSTVRVVKIFSRQGMPLISRTVQWMIFL